MRVNDLAAVAGTTVRTIRYYHQLGLLSVPDTDTTWRSYGFAHLTRLMRIRWLVESGVPLAEVPHLLGGPDGASERAAVTEDLDAVRASINAKIATLTAQRERVDVLRERVATEGRLSPLPPSVERLYDALLARPMPPDMIEAISRERDLLELACYRGALPDELVTLIDAVTREDLAQLCRLWEECLALGASAKNGLTPAIREQVTDVVRRTVDLAARAEPDATRQLLTRAKELQRPVLRTTVELAYPAPVLRQFVASVALVAAERVATERSTV